MYRPRRRVISRLGDSSPEDHGGGALVKVGRELVIEYTPGAEGEGYGRDHREPDLTLYRVDVPTIRGRCDIEGIRRDLDWIDWNAVAKSVDLSPWEVLEIALDPTRAWGLYEIVAGYYGWDNLDLYPETFPYWRIARRWVTPRRRPAASSSPLNPSV